MTISDILEQIDCLWARYNKEYKGSQGWGCRWGIKVYRQSGPIVDGKTSYRWSTSIIATYSWVPKWRRKNIISPYKILHKQLLERGPDSGLQTCEIYGLIVEERKTVQNGTGKINGNASIVITLTIDTDHEPELPPLDLEDDPVRYITRYDLFSIRRTNYS